MRAAPEFAVVTPGDCLGLALALGKEAELVFQPLMGGLAPELGWRSLELFIAEVLPALADAGYR
jgi:hypothetical protein